MTDKKKKLEKATKVINVKIVEEVDAEEFDDKEVGIVIETEVIGKKILWV